jgi:hypothetical protein
MSYEEACNKVAGFRSMSEEFTRKLVIDGRSRSTHENYLRQMAKLSLHYTESPLDQMYNLLFSVAWDVLSDFGKDTKWLG